MLGLTQFITHVIVISMLSASTSQTKKIAQDIAKKIQRNYFKSRKGPLVIALAGDLGAGKTFFVKNFLQALGVKEKVSSPTFVLMREYKIKKSMAGSKKYTKAYHIDVYRFSDLEDLRRLKFKDVLKEKNAIVLIEWADRIKKLLPKKTIWIRFEHGAKENERMIDIGRIV